jgi:hypothetical protein
VSIVYRPADLEHPDDLRFVVDSWVSSYRDADSAGMIQVEDWYAVMIPQVTKAIRRPDVQTILACGADDPTQLHGFITADVEERLPLVYYVFVKTHYRRGGRGRLWDGHGCARGLFAALSIDPGKPFFYVCETPMVPRLRRKIPAAKHMPKYGRFPKSERKAGR